MGARCERTGLPTPYQFDGKNLHDGVINRGDRPTLVGTGQGDFMVGPGQGLLPTLYGPKIVEIGDYVVPRMDGTWRVSRKAPTPGRKDDRWTTLHEPPCSGYS